MMVEKEDLGLSLSLTSTQNHHSLHLNLMPSLVPSSGFNPRPSWNETFPSSGALMDFVKFAWLSFLDLGFAHNTRFKEAIFAFFFQLSRNLDKNNTFFFFLCSFIFNFFNNQLFSYSHSEFLKSTTFSQVLGSYSLDLSIKIQSFSLILTHNPTCRSKL